MGKGGKEKKEKNEKNCSRRKILHSKWNGLKLLNSRLEKSDVIYESSPPVPAAPLQGRRQLTPCLPREHRHCPQDLCPIPAQSGQRTVTSPEQLCEGKWPCIMPEVRNLGQRSSKSLVCPSSLLNKSPNYHLPFFRAYKEIKQVDSTDKMGSADKHLLQMLFS